MDNPAVPTTDVIVNVFKRRLFFIILRILCIDVIGIYCGIVTTSASVHDDIGKMW